MNRRAYLAAAGTAMLAGCLTAPPAGGGEGHSETLRVVDFDVTRTQIAPTKRYFCRITDVYSTAAVERESGTPTVKDVSAIEDPAVREAVREILRTGKLWREEIPTGLTAVTERVDFFTWEARTEPEDTATHWGIAVYETAPEADPVLRFDAELLEDRIGPDAPAAIEFSLANEGDWPVEVFSGTVPPFSVLWAEREADAGRALLWREYAAEGCVGFAAVDGETVVERCSIGVLTPIEPGATITRRYELRHGFDEPALSGAGFDEPGAYRVRDTLSYHREAAPQGPSTEVDWSVSFDLRRVD
jgi:hypothetical protein